MKKVALLTILLLPFWTKAQNIKEKVFDYQKCKDAMVVYIEDNYLSRNDKNYGKIPYFSVASWTLHGNFEKQCALIDFNTKSLPKNAIIINATLTLHRAPNITHFKNSGLVSIEISSIKSQWNENKVCWNKQPEITNNYKLVVELNPEKDFFEIDVTQLVKEKVKSPQLNHGFYLKPASDDYYQGIAFASSEYSDKSLRPTLTVKYFVPESNGKSSEKGKHEAYTLLVYNSKFQLIEEKKINSMQMYFDEVERLKGDRFLCIVIQNDKVVSSNIIDKEN